MKANQNALRVLRNILIGIGCISCVHATLAQSWTIEVSGSEGGMISPASLTSNSVVVIGSQSGIGNSYVTYENGSVNIDAATSQLYAGEEAWVVATEQLEDSSSPILPHSWHVKEAVRFGGGSFTSQNFIQGNFRVIAMEISDFDKNGKLDVVVNTSITLSGTDYFITYVYWDDQFSTTAIGRWASAFSTQPRGDIRCGDMNGDGLPDLLIEKVGSGIEILKGDAIRSFITVTNLPGSFSAFECADMDNDGDLDIIGVSGNELYLYRNNGLARFSRDPSSHSVTGVTDIAILDANMDGNADVMVGTQASCAEALFLNEGGSLQQLSLAMEDVDTKAVFPVNLDHEAGPDLFFLQDTNSVLWVNDGSGVYTQSVIITGQASMQNMVGAWGDVTGDGQDDVVVAGIGVSGGVPPYLFNALTSWEPGIVSMVDVRSIALGDLNNDGALDIVVGTESGGLVSGKIFYNLPPPRHVQPYISSYSSDNYGFEWAEAHDGEAVGYDWELRDLDALDDTLVSSNFITALGINLDVSGISGGDGRLLQFRLRPYNASGDKGDWREITFPRGYTLAVSSDDHGNYSPDNDLVATNLMVTVDPGYRFSGFTSTHSNAVSSVKLSTRQSEVHIDPALMTPVSTLTLHLNFSLPDYVSEVDQEWLDDLPDDGSGLPIPMQDADSDGARNWEEFYAGTSPTEPDDVFEIIDFDPVSGQVVWSSKSGKTYTVERSMDLMSDGFSNVTSLVVADGTNAVSTLPAEELDGAFIRVRLKLE